MNRIQENGDLQLKDNQKTTINLFEVEKCFTEDDYLGLTAVTKTGIRKYDYKTFEDCLEDFCNIAWFFMIPLPLTEEKIKFYLEGRCLK